MKLYNTRTNKYEEWPENIAQHKLKWQHLDVGGKYLRLDEVKDRVQVPPPIPGTKEVPNTPIPPPPVNAPESIDSSTEPGTNPEPNRPHHEPRQRRRR